MSVDTQAPPATATARVLPERIDIPPMRGEMLELRPAMQQDLPLLDEIDSYYNASMITGKDQESERAMVHDWVARSEAWSQGRSSHRRAAFDPQSRGTIAWSIVTGSGEASDEDDAHRLSGSQPRSSTTRRGSTSINPSPPINTTTLRAAVVMLSAKPRKA